MEIRALTPAEQKYTYAQSMQLEGQTANIGHLRGDFDSSGYGFYTTWTDTRTQWKTDEFKVEFDERMQQNGATYEPKQAEQPPHKAPRKNDYER